MNCFSSFNFWLASVINNCTLVFFFGHPPNFLFWKVLGKFAFQLLNGVGDYLTLSDVLNPDGRPDWDKMTEEEILTKVLADLLNNNI